MLLDNAFSYLPHLVWWKDKNRVYQGGNNNFYDFIGVVLGEAVGKTDEDLPWEKDCFENLRKEEEFVLHNKEARRNIVQVLWVKNKSPITVRMDFIPYFSEDEKMMGILIFAIKIDNQDLNQNIFFSYMLDHLPYYIFWKDANSVYLGCNQNFARLIGLPVEKIVGKTDYDLNWGEGEADLFVQADKAVMAGKKQVNAEETLVQPDNTKITMLVSKTPVYNQDNQVIGMLGISVDITDMKNVQEELRLAKERAEVASQAKASFLDNMRHDIRTPLSNIIGAAELLKNKEKDSENLLFIEGIVSSAQALLDFLTNLLKFNNLASGNEPVRLKKFSLQEVIKKLKNTMSISAIQKKLEFTLEYDEKIPEHVIGDEFRIYLILLNLLSNAFKFTDSGFVRLVVKLEKVMRKTAIISFVVQDAGIGIAPENHDIIFGRFEKLTPSYTGIHKGEGLGLHIVKQFTEELEGELEVESDIGKGSTFKCIIPFKVPLLEADL